MSRAVRPQGARSRRRQTVRATFVAGLAAIGVALLWILGINGGTDYRVHAQFTNAGQLVTGGRVEVAGQAIGSIARISMTDDGLADVELKITDDRFVPFRASTRASIRAVGQATLTNRYVAIDPGASDAPTLPDGGVLDRDHVRGIVDLDAILSSVDGEFRNELKGLFRGGAEIYAGSGAQNFNAMLRTLDPAMAQITGLTEELARDHAALRRLVKTGATAAAAADTRSRELESAVGGSATTFAAIARERESLTDALSRAPAVLRQAGGTLKRSAATAQALRPTLRAVPKSESGLRLLLRRVPRTLNRVEPAMARFSALLPTLDAGLRALTRLEGPASDAIPGLSGGLDASLPILEGLRFYGSDLLLGVVKGLAAVASGGHNAVGHYVKLEFVQNIQTALGGAFAPIVPSLTPNGVLPGIINVSTDQRARCPGSNAPPAPDGSSPWYPKVGICDPAINMSPLVNSPTAFCHQVNRCDGQPAWPAADVPPALRAPNQAGSK